MQKIWSFKSKLNGVAIRATTATPSPETSIRVKNRPAPSRALFPETTAAPTLPVQYVAIKHSNAFNSERATGMNKLQQLQFVEVMERMIVDSAALLYGGFDEGATLKVVMTRKRGHCSVNPRTFSDEVVHVAKLVSRIALGSREDWVLLEQSEEMEYLTDAVENLWEKVMDRAGAATEDLAAGEKVLSDQGGRGKVVQEEL